MKDKIILLNTILNPILVVLAFTIYQVSKVASLVFLLLAIINIDKLVLICLFEEKLK